MLSSVIWYNLLILIYQFWFLLQLHIIFLFSSSKYLMDSSKYFRCSIIDLLFLMSLMYLLSRPTRWDAISDVYFWFYLFFLALRTGFMLYVASTINDSSRISLRYIRKFPSRNWCVDVRMIHCIYFYVLKVNKYLIINFYLQAASKVD